MTAATWQALRGLTAARIGLGRAGPGIATVDHLAFRAAHALARDAVRGTLDLNALADAVRQLGLDPEPVESACPDHATYLARPDLGRRLAPGESERLSLLAQDADVVFLLAGGLSAVAVGAHAVPLLASVLPGVRAWGWQVAPVCLTRFGRVGLGDAVGAALAARMVVVLIGERPGLTSPDSLGAYLTYAPRLGRSDADRNCLSNIRPAGQPIAAAAQRLLWHMSAAATRCLTGIALKDESDTEPRLADAAPIAINRPIQP